MVELQTKRLILRELTPGDVPAMHAIDSDSEVARWNGFPPVSMEQSQDWVRMTLASAMESPRQFYTLAIVTRDAGEVVGRCGLDRGGPDLLEGMLGYALRRDRWGQGIMTEAVRALVTHGFGELGLHRIWADCDPRNAGSWRVMEKAGMRREGHMLENFRDSSGEWHDSYLYAILNREWRAAGHG